MGMNAAYTKRSSADPKKAKKRPTVKEGAMTAGQEGIPPPSPQNNRSFRIVNRQRKNSYLLLAISVLINSSVEKKQRWLNVLPTLGNDL
jgi:hypothetical protein